MNIETARALKLLRLLEIVIKVYNLKAILTQKNQFIRADSIRMKIEIATDRIYS